MAVLGAGSWGTALALLLARNGHQVRLWGHHPAHVQEMAALHSNPAYFPGITFPSSLGVCTDLKTCVQDVEEVLVVVPSHAFSATLESIAPYLSSRTSVFWGTKGLNADGRWLHEVALQQLGPHRKLAILSGPSFAKEVIEEKPTAVTIASHDPLYSERLCQLLSNHYFRAYQSTDILGVQLGGALKNSLAIAAGIVDGSRLGANARSALITRGLAEMMRLGEAVGAKASTLMGLAGVGDLILTCTDNQSRNHRFGVLLGQGAEVEKALKEIGQVVEGVKTTERILRLKELYRVEMPISQCVAEVLSAKISIKQAVHQLMTRPLKVE